MTKLQKFAATLAISTAMPALGALTLGLMGIILGPLIVSTAWLAVAAVVLSTLSTLALLVLFLALIWQ